MKDFRPPIDQQELESREAAGFWKAIGLVNELSRKKDSVIDVETIRLVHRTIFADVQPDIAGKFRVAGEDLRKLHHIIPPPGVTVAGRMLEFGRELDERLRMLRPVPKTRNVAAVKTWVRDVVMLAAWVQHQIVAIHPFSNGNGRTARLLTNLILQKNGLVGSRIKFEQQDKTAYLNALAQIDKVVDYEPLITIIYRAMEDQYKVIIARKRRR